MKTIILKLRECESEINNLIMRFESIGDTNYDSNRVLGNIGYTKGFIDTRFEQIFQKLKYKILNEEEENNGKIH